jgi:hypothetical protein
MLVRVDLLQTSTMASGTYLNNTTGVTVDIWKATSTASTGNKLVSAQNLLYVSASDGRYDATIQSTSVSSMAKGTIGMAVITLVHGTLNAEWRRPFRVQDRGTS